MCKQSAASVVDHRRQGAERGGRQGDQRRPLLQADFAGDHFAGMIDTRFFLLEGDAGFGTGA